MRFLILRILTHSELGMFHEYRRLRKEGSKQRAVNFDAEVVDRVFPAAHDTDKIPLVMRYLTDEGIAEASQWLKRQEKNWRLEGVCPRDRCYSFVESGCLFVMDVNSGSKPAVGSWAVFPRTHSITREILSHGESRMLSRVAMVALYGDEGRHIRRLLSERHPELFVSERGVQVVDSSLTNSSGKKKLPPRPERLVNILSSVGHSFPSAVADIVDNAISADATRVDITFGPPDAGHGRWVSIVDNGKGMTQNQLDEAMRVGSDSSYDEFNLGKYGYGLKGASWSQAEVFTVVSKVSGKPGNHLTWDTKDMGDWEPKSDPLNSWESEVAAIDDHGTAILWKDMRPPQSAVSLKGLSPHEAEIVALERHLALVFHRFIEGRARGRKAIEVKINGVPVKANNPVGHPKTSSYDVKSIRIPVGKKDFKVTVAPFLLPSEEEIEKFHAAEDPLVTREALDKIGLHGKRNETQGLFIYRNDRLIKWGGWHEMWSTNDEKTKLARLVVDFGRELDDTFRINISKQIVHLPSHLQDQIKKLAERPRKDSQSKYRRNKKRGAAAAPPNRSPQPDDLQSIAIPTSNPSAAGGPAALPVVVKTVSTPKFIWKVAKGITGAVDLQVSDLDPNLRALVKDLANQPNAIANLVAFLSRLDRVDAQQALIKKELAD